jgi:hypothetical protein
MSLALAVMLPMLLGGTGKQVPVYTGMTVSGAVTPDEALAAPEDHVAVIKNDSGVRIIPLSGENRALALYRSRHGKLDHEEPFDDGKNDIVDRIDDVLSVVGVGEEIYYAKANEDVYITVHVDNPDDFEILSFTLNKKTYASYMFEKGSDMENLILKYNVGDTIILGTQTGSYYASQTSYNSATGSSYTRGYEASNYTTMYSEASLAAAILAGTVTYMSNRDGEYFIIKGFNVECPTRKNSTLLGRMEVRGYVRGVGGVIVENFDKALELGEIRALGIIMNRDIAIEKLKVAKEELDLGILSQEEFDTIKNDLIPYIKQK